MANLADALARRGHCVTYLAEETLSSERFELGWEPPTLQHAQLILFDSQAEARRLVRQAPARTMHLTQGVRANGHIGPAQVEIEARRQKQFILMETVNELGLMGFLKRPLYAIHLRRLNRKRTYILAIGKETPGWLRRIAPRDLSVIPFAYFLKKLNPKSDSRSGSKFRFLFVGSLIEIKRLDLFLTALSLLSDYDFDLEVVGDGKLRSKLEDAAAQLLPGRVIFRGVRPISEVPSYLADADCLVLPSSHDGWGAVVSEAIMAGTPVVCSSGCGSREVVEASGEGGIFEVNDLDSLTKTLEVMLERGPVKARQRRELALWGQCLGVDAGARYLESLLRCDEPARFYLLPPWLSKREEIPEDAALPPRSEA